MSQTGYDYAPKGKPKPVCQPGEFLFAAVALDHGHIKGQCNGLIEAGGRLRWVFDPDPLKVQGVIFRIPSCSFPGTGLYWVEFHYNDKVIAREPLLVR